MSLQALAARTRAGFAEVFGRAPTALVQAPGRVNLIGEHTDYNDGFVLPCAIDRATVVAWRLRADRQVHLLALDQASATSQFDLDAPIAPDANAPWSNYVRGVVQQLLIAGYELPGVELCISGDVPQGAGLSSSASLEVAVAQTFRIAGDLQLDANRLALIAQRAENEFVGCNCGIMDQLVSARGEAGHALLIDCRSLQTRAVLMPADVAVLIVHSMVQRGLVESHYNQRRAACEAAARALGVPALRDATLAALLASNVDDTTLRRARHVISENQRTLDAAQALARNDLQSLGQLMRASHASMRDDFEITTPAIDQLVHIANDAIAGEGGCRMTGGGFGGCVVALLRNADVARVRAAIERQYRGPSGELPLLFLCSPSQGAGVVLSA
jgi:galactokinase